MNARMRLLVPSLLLLIPVTTGCGSDATDGAGSPDSASPSQMTDTPAPAGGSEIASVTLDRAGGLRPTRVHRIFSADGSPPRGFTSADVDAALAAAQRFVASETSLAPMPSAPCCDLYTYTVTITHADGTSTSYQTVDGLGQPRAFENLLSALA